MISNSFNDMRYYKKILLEDIRILKDKLFEKELELKQLNTNIIENCDHEWIIDYIDSIQGYKLSQRIKYCKKCEYTDNIK